MKALMTMTARYAREDRFDPAFWFLLVFATGSALLTCAIR